MNIETPYSTTHSGRRISITEGVPAVVDISLGLSRIVRFAGQGQRFFSVAHHSLWMDDYYQHQLANPDDGMRLAILLHDAHEAVTSDIVSPLKAAEQRGIQNLLDQRLFDRYFHPYGGFTGYRETFYPTVKQLDWWALETEFWEIGPAHPCYISKPQPEQAKYFRQWLRGYQEATMEEAAIEYSHRMLRLL